MAFRPPDEAIMGLYTWTPTDERCIGYPGGGAEPSKDIDIIAVQGLGASPYYTWIKKVAKADGGVEEVMWLRDLLPEFVPNARIATFSYRSDWYTYKKGAKKTSIRDLGEQLLTVLHYNRESIKAPRRPIVFIGHSMGGLVIQQALVHANNRPEYEDIKISTAGIVFLGTPHEGSTIAEYAKYLAVVKGNDPHLLKQLEPKEEQLYDLSHDFAAGYKHLSIICFYEKLDKAYLGGLLEVPVVDKRSAVQVGRGMMYLLADHSGLNKFSGVDDPNFKSVRAVIAGMVDKASEREVPHLYNHQFMISRRPNPLFTGREAELNRLRDALCPLILKDNQNTAANIYLLYGMGGAGKSEVALKFVYDHRSRFWGIFWIDARSETSITTGFMNIARRCGLDESINGAVSWLQDTSYSWLLILDNADDPKLDLSPYLPAGIKGNIIITSRVPDARQYENAGSDYYERLDEETATELLFKSCRIDFSSRSEYEDDSHIIVNLLGCHALAVVQAGATISHGICKLEEYKSMFLNQRRALLEYLPPAKSEYGDVYATFEVSAKYLERRSDQVAKDALQLLDFHAFMHFSDFPESAFEEAWKNSKNKNLVKSNLRLSDEKKIYQLDPWHRSNLPTFMRQSLYNNELDMISLRKARDQLASLSLINIDPFKGITRIHPVTHAWSRDRLKDPGSAGAWFNALALLSLSSPDLIQYHPLQGLLQSHLESMVKRPSYFDIYRNTYSIQQSLYRLAHILCILRSWSAAYEMIQLIPTRTDDAWINTSHGQEIQFLQAQCVMEIGGLEEAKVLLEEIDKAKAKSSEAEDDLHMDVQIAIARLYIKFGKTAGAIEILERVIELKRRKLGDAENRSFLDTQYELGVAYYRIDHLWKARMIFEQVVKSGTRILKAEDPSQWSAEHNLGRVYLLLGDTIEATKIFEQVTQAKSRHLKPNNPSRLRSEYLLAKCYYNSGRYEDSLRLAVSLQHLAQNMPGEPLADRITRLNRHCLEAKELEKLSDGYESLQEVEHVDENKDQG